MRNRFVIGLLWLGCCLVGAAEPATNLVSIYLVGDKIERTIYASPPPALPDLKLVLPAVISDADFVAFDTTNRTFSITPGAAKRLAREIWKLGTGEVPHVGGGGLYELVATPVPYVLMASGRRICSGMFWTLHSSLPPQFPGPVILPDEALLRTNQDRRVTFSIRSEGSTPDPCQDGRLVIAVHKLLAHEER